MYRRSVIVLDSCPIRAASTVELMPRLIIRLANACRIEWNVTPSIPASVGGRLEAAAGGVAMPERSAVAGGEHRLGLGRVARAEPQGRELLRHLL